MRSFWFVVGVMFDSYLYAGQYVSYLWKKVTRR